MKLWLVSLLGLLLVGCASEYVWVPQVPEDMRSIVVPTFQNETDLTELGPIATRQVLREIEREGTFKIRPEDSAALEIQGVIKKVSSSALAYNRRAGLRTSAHEFTLRAEISVIDKKRHEVLVNNKPYEARTTFSALHDFDTAKRDASGRLAEDLARQVVDDLLMNLKERKQGVGK